MIAASPNTTTTNKTTIMVDNPVVEDVPSYYPEEAEDDGDFFLTSGPMVGLNHRGANVTSSSLPCKTEVMIDHNNNNKLNLYDLLYTGMSSSNCKNKNAMKSRLQNQPLSSKGTTKMTGCTMMRRSASHDPQGVRNASWGIDHHTKSPSRSSFPSGNHMSPSKSNHSMRATRTMIQKKASSIDSATRLQQGVNEMLEMLQSTTFVGTVDPLFHGHYLKAGEEKVDDEMSVTEKQEVIQSWKLRGSPATQGRVPPTSMVVLVPHNNASPSSSSVSLVSFAPQ